MNSSPPSINLFSFILSPFILKLSLIKRNKYIFSSCRKLLLNPADKTLPTHEKNHRHAERESASKLSKMG